MQQILKQILPSVTNGQVPDDKILDDFATLYQLIKEGNQRINVTSILDENGFAVKHIYDSLTVANFIPTGSRVLDVGTGGGFPTLPLAIFRRDLKITAMDSTEKKINFVLETANNLGVNIAAICGRAEELAFTDMRESFDVVVARAVAPLNTLIEYCVPFVKLNGLFIALKGVETELDAAKQALKVFNLQVECVNELDLPLDMGKRSIIVFKKNAPTNVCYPRSGGKPRKSPIA